MNRYKCPRCNTNQYSSDPKKENEPCIHCGNKETKLMEDINEEEKSETN